MTRALAQPALLDRPVREVMEPPFPVVEATTPTDRVGADAHPGEPGGAGPEGRQADRDREPVRRAAAADRDRGRASRRSRALHSSPDAVHAHNGPHRRHLRRARRRPRVGGAGHRGAAKPGARGGGGGHRARLHPARRTSRRCSRASVGTEPPSIDQLHGLEQGLLLSGLANLAVVRDAEVLFLALHGGRGEDGTSRPCSRWWGCPTPGAAAWAARWRWTRTSRSGSSGSPGCRRPTG